MASTQQQEEPASSTADQEIKELKTIHDSKCSVIKDMGCYQYIVSVKLTSPNIKIKLQLESTYPVSRPNVVVTSPSGLYCKDVLGKLTKYLTSRGGRTLSTLVQDAVDWLENEGTVISAHSPNPAQVHDKVHRKQKTKKSKEITEKPIEEKKSSMKTADDCIKRIMWDDALSSDEFSVGYIDRFLGLMEKPFEAFTWEDLAAVDYGVLAIPQHRIQYFKYKDVKIWDKNERLDNMFGSTGGKMTIQDIVAKYEAGELQKPETKPEVETADVNQNDEDDSSDDDDDDINVVINAEMPREDIRDDQSDSDDDNPSQQNDPFWMNKLRPNYFIALRITDHEIKDTVNYIQDGITEQESRYAECCIKDTALHVTLCTLRLDNAEHVAAAVQELKSHQEDLQAIIDSNWGNIELAFDGIGTFNQRVLYAKAKYEDAFIEFVDGLNRVLSTGGFLIKDIHDFVPHLTIMKVSRPVSRAMGTRYINPFIYSGAEKTTFGKQKIDAIHLCSMREQKDSDGFYNCATTLTFNTAENAEEF